MKPMATPEVSEEANQTPTMPSSSCKKSSVLAESQKKPMVQNSSNGKKSTSKEKKPGSTLKQQALSFFIAK